MITGIFPAWLFSIIGSVSAMISIIICYYIAVKNGHEKPWPHCYISNTARHYPEFIYFRFGTISAAVFNILSYFIHYFWLLSICRDNIFHIRKYYPQIFVILGITGTFFLFGSTATIDTGIMNMTWHQDCAGIFFIVTIIAMFYNASICILVYLKTGQISNLSIGVKVLITALLVYQIILKLFYDHSFFKKKFDDFDNNLDHILEYTLAFSVLFYMMAFAIDLKGYKMAYREVKH